MLEAQVQITVPPTFLFVQGNSGEMLLALKGIDKLFRHLESLGEMFNLLSETAVLCLNLYL